MPIAKRWWASSFAMFATEQATAATKRLRRRGRTRHCAREENPAMSFLKRLFGGGSGDAPASAAPAKQVEHNGFTISATPYKADGQYQTCGVVSKEIGGVVKEHRFIR